MEKFLNETQTIYWWLSVVIVGLIINIFASYLFKRYEFFSAVISQKKRNEIEERKRVRNNLINVLVNNYEGKQYIHNEIINLKLDSIRAFLVGALFFLVPAEIEIFYVFGLVGDIIRWILFSIGAIVIIIGYNKGKVAYSRGDVLRQVAEKEKALKKVEPPPVE